MHRLLALSPVVILGFFIGTGSASGAGPDSAVQRVALDGAGGGQRFDGIGIIDGGGATSVLLKDYPEPQRSQILDMVYKPRFGASVSALYVEIPGDGNSTQGSTPSHMHTRNDVNYARGYTWWVLAEARKRNPRLTLDGAAWSAPGWIGDGDGGTLFARVGDYGDKPFFSQDTADYYVSWLKGLRKVYSLELDAIGLRNEKGVSYGLAKAMRKTLDANGFSKVKLHGFDNWPKWKLDFVKDMLDDKELRDALDIVSAHLSPLDGTMVDPAVRQMAAQMGKPLWNTEQHVYKAGYDGLISTVKSFNDGHIRSGFTKIVDWYGIAGLYTMEPYSGEKEAILRANWPWSGTYQVNPKLWAFAHYGQFTEAGWQYLDEGSGSLDGGGSYVSLKSPQNDYSVIIETKDAKAAQRLRLDVTGLSTAPLALWRSNASEQFVRQPDLAVERGGFTVTLEPNAVYSLTTTRGQQKGDFGSVPERKPFPFPYYETFDGYGKPEQWGYLPRYFADIYGAFELAPCPGGKGGCLRQSAPVNPISWAPGWSPYTIIGDDQWQDYDVGADVHLASAGSAGVMGRVNDVGTGYGVIPKGYYLSLAASGEVRLTVVRGKVDKKKPVGDAEQQALIKANKDSSAGGEQMLASARLDGFKPDAWHNLKLRFEGATITGLVDGKPVLTVTDTLYASGMAGLLAGRDGRALGTPYFDNLAVTRPAAPLPAPTAAQPGQRPLYN